MSNDKNILTPAEIASIYATSTKSGDRQVNGIAVHRVSCAILYVDSSVFLKAPFNTVIVANAGISLADGSLNAPSIRFSSDPTLGLFRSAPGVITFTNGGIPTAELSPTSLAIANELTTLGGGDLSLNPAGPNIDFNGKNLINVGSTTSNPNKYEFSSVAHVTTSDDTPTAIAVIPTSTNASYSIICQASCVSTVDNTSTGAFRLFFKAKNIGGTVTIDNVATILDSILDNPINTALIEAVASGTNININGIGLAGITIRWYAGGEVVRVTIS